MSRARPVLERLLRRAESARRRGAEGPVSQPMHSVAEYTELASLADLDAFHADIALAERAGAVVVQRDRRRGDGTALLRLTVDDLSALARHLGAELLEDRVAAAAQRLAPWRHRFPVLDEAIAAWRQGRKVRGSGPEAAHDLAAAASVVAARADDAGHERILRRESVRLLGDSKRLEKLTPWLELLIAGELVSSGLAQEDVWSAIGLRREPQPLLLAGEGMVTLNATVLPLARPYLGLPMESLRSIATHARYLLTIENLASFHDAASTPGAEVGLLVYTGGMPSPAWRAAYACILGGLAAGTPIYHWGDIDQGGFRIAATLAQACAEAARRLLPWRMSPDELPTDVVCTDATPAALDAMVRWAERAGWDTVARQLPLRPICVEQEALAARLPAAAPPDH